MNESRSLSQGQQAMASETAPPGTAQAQPVHQPQGIPSVTKLFARMFGGGAAQPNGRTFAQTQWQDTEWQDTRSLSSRS